MFFDGESNSSKKSTISIKYSIYNSDDWETDPNFENKATEEEQRWGTGADRGAAIKYDENFSHN